MTTDQATELMLYLIACFPTAAVPTPTSNVYLEHLEALPYERAKAAISGLVMTHRYPSLPTIAEVLEAVGVDDDASRAQLRAAMAARQPLVRDAASSTGWAVGEAAYPPAALAARNAAEATKALPGPLVDAARQQGLRARLRRFAGALSVGNEPVAGEWR